ncbi:MAG: hypothetical protein PHU51_02210 [Candidatus Nanoarchaeia archaeon]|nr:hypothetical protein [Candidatus Nanoarchaeia archaeon]
MKSKQDYLRMLFGEPKAREENSVLDRIQNTAPPPLVFSGVNIEDILEGQTFEDTNSKGLKNALQQALDYVGEEGYIPNMRELISAKIIADKSHDFWKKWYSVHTEENIGIDTQGLYKKGEEIVLIINGGGIWTPDRIQKSYNDGLIDGSGKIHPNEWNDLLKGKLPNGKSLNQIYTYDEIYKGISNLPHQYGVVVPYSMVKNLKSGQVKKKDFLKNPLVIARNGGLENLEKYYEMASDSDGLGCYHPFDGRSASTPQGRVLFLNYGYGGLGGSYSLDNNGRFVGVGVGDAKR